MIDLHTHLLPGLDDGAPDLATSIAMARMAVADGTRIMACTPHRMPGRYDTAAQQIEDGVRSLQGELSRAGVELQLIVGSDVHIAPDLPAVLRDHPAYRLNRTRYFLFEPPHQIAPPGMVRVVEDVVAAGFVPVLTHPERLQWVEQKYDLLVALNEAGCLMQITCASLTGRFGAGRRKLALRMLEEGRIDLLASDGHNLEGRPPIMGEAYRLVRSLVDEATARRMCVATPAAILRDRPLEPAMGRTPLALARQGADSATTSPGRSLFGWLRG